jgi:hypothetical protein
MTKEKAMEYLKIAAKVTEDACHLEEMRDEGRTLFITGRNMYEIHMYDIDAFKEMGKLLEQPIVINTDREVYNEAFFYTPIDGYKQRWKIYALFDKEKGWGE